MNKILKYIYIVIGAFIAALSINIFFVPNNISTGGASGIGIILNYLFKFPIGVIVIVLNLPLFIISFFKLGFKFTVKALIGTLLLSFFIDVTTNISKLEVFNISNNYILSSIFGGLLMGFGLSLVFKGGSSTGGSDLLAQIVYKYRPYVSMSQILLILDSTIVISSMFAFKSFASGLYAIIAIFVSKKTIDTVFEGVNYTKVINIITKNSEKITEQIMKEVERGVTSIKCIGEYTKGEYTKIECVATIPQIYRIKEIVRTIDKESFIYIAPATEVLGYGFKEYN